MLTGWSRAIFGFPAIVLETGIDLSNVKKLTTAEHFMIIYKSGKKYAT